MLPSPPSPLAGCRLGMALTCKLVTVLVPVCGGVGLSFVLRNAPGDDRQALRIDIERYTHYFSCTTCLLFCARPVRVRTSWISKNVLSEVSIGGSLGCGLCTDHGAGDPAVSRSGAGASGVKESSVRWASRYCLTAWMAWVIAKGAHLPPASVYTTCAFGPGLP